MDGCVGCMVVLVLIPVLLYSFLWAVVFSMMFLLTIYDCIEEKCRKKKEDPENPDWWV